jgi:hypothetical protein
MYLCTSILLKYTVGFTMWITTELTFFSLSYMESKWKYTKDITLGEKLSDFSFEQKNSTSYLQYDNLSGHCTEQCALYHRRENVIPEIEAA